MDRTLLIDCEVLGEVWLTLQKHEDIEMVVGKACFENTAAIRLKNVPDIVWNALERELQKLDIEKNTIAYLVK